MSSNYGLATAESRRRFRPICAGEGTSNTVQEESIRPPHPETSRRARNFGRAEGASGAGTRSGRRLTLRRQGSHSGRSLTQQALRSALERGQRVRRSPHDGGCERLNRFPGSRRVVYEGEIYVT